ncbi:hypothetical protein GW17_00043347 [Ensete ventricosum]|nr:hypothetical protein GW17_00043347 [Ensete ventricosum]
MLRPGVTQEWVGEGELPRELTKKNWRWRRPYDVLAEAIHGEVIVQLHHTRICTIEEEVRLQVPVSPMEGDLIIQRYDRSGWRVRLLQCSYSLKVARQVRGHGRRRAVESSIPCSHGGRALVIKGAEEVENAKANSKYQDRVKRQRPRNFIRLVSMGFSSR